MDRVASIRVFPAAMVGSVILCVVFGGMWYGPLFGKLWGKLMKIDTTQPPPAGNMIAGVMLNAIGHLFSAFVLSHLIEVWKTSVNPFYDGFIAALLVWLGFYVPMGLNSVAWEQRTFGLFALNSAYNFLNLQIIAAIIVYCSLDA